MTFNALNSIITPCKIRVWDMKDELVMNATPLYEGRSYEIPDTASFMNMPIYEIMPMNDVLVIFIGERNRELVGRK